MFLYLDTSALVKRYVAEENSEDVAALMDGAAAVGTAFITQTEMAAALARAVREDRLTNEDGRRAHENFLQEWPDFGRVPLTDTLFALADGLAWDHSLRAYDAVQLAAALTCQDPSVALGDDVVFACFDNHLREAARSAGLQPWPAE